MILVDTSVWITHFQRTNLGLKHALNNRQILVHPFILGEMALSHIKDRSGVLEELGALPKAEVARPEEALTYVERHQLYGRGIGWVDVHLVVSSLLCESEIWTFDRRLSAAATRCGIPVHLEH